MAEETFIGALAGINLEQGISPDASFDAKVRGHASENRHDRPDASALRQSLYLDTGPGPAAARAEVDIDAVPK